MPPILRPHDSSTVESSAYDLERVVVSAHKLDRAWRSPAPTLRQWQFNAHWAIHEMTPVPGGEFLVASVRGGDNEEKERAVVVYAMDTQSTTVVAPLIWLPTPGVAYHLSACYLSVDDVAGMLVTYVSREWEDAKYADSG